MSLPPKKYARKPREVGPGTCKKIAWETPELAQIELDRLKKDGTLGPEFRVGTKCRFCYEFHHTDRVRIPKEQRKKMHYPDVRKPAGTIRTGLSKDQMRKMSEVMKVRPGESHERWKWRTRNYRILDDEEMAKTKDGKRKIRLNKKGARMVKKQNKVQKRNFLDLQLTDFHNGDYNYLKYYLAVSTFCALKFEMRKEDLELCLYFYGHPPFTREYFIKKGLVASSKSAHTFHRFEKSGYVVPLSSVKGTGGLYRLSAEMHSRVTEFYEKMAFPLSENQKDEKFKATMTNTDRKPITDWFMEMRRTAQDILRNRSDVEFSKE